MPDKVKCPKCEKVLSVKGIHSHIQRQTCDKCGKSLSYGGLSQHRKSCEEIKIQTVKDEISKLLEECKHKDIVKQRAFETIKTLKGLTTLIEKIRYMYANNLPITWRKLRNQKVSETFAQAVEDAAEREREEALDKWESNIDINYID